MRRPIVSRLILLAGLAAPAPALAADDLLQAFDNTFATAAPHQLVPARPAAVQPAPAQPYIATPGAPRAPFEAQLAALAEGSHGRIGVAAFDFATGRSVGVLADQPFPLASTAKVAIAATFLEGVDQGRWHLTDRFPLMVPLPSHKFEGAVAPVRQGELMSALDLIELSITRSDNHATDALLAAIGGPAAVDRWLARAGVQGMRLDHDIATMVRDDGAVNPATTIDPRDSTTPLAMTRLLAGLYRGEWLSEASRDVLLGAMSRCRTGTHRIRALLPETAVIGHKTGTLSNTSSDVGFFRTVDGHPVAVAIYVTGQGTHAGRDSRIASIARAIFDDYHPENPARTPTGTR